MHNITVVSDEDLKLSNYITETSHNATLNLSSYIEDIIAKYAKPLPQMRSLSCLHCGATLTQRVNDHIVKCQYCGFAYAIDTEMIWDVREE